MSARHFSTTLAICSSFAAGLLSPTQGVGKESQTVDSLTADEYYRMMDSIMLGKREKVLLSLEAVVERASSTDWAGDDAEPISAVAVQATEELLAYLLQEHVALREPAVIPTVDSSIQIEWHDRDRSLEFSFTGTKWIALGVELLEGIAPKRYTVSCTGQRGFYIAGKCYEWFVRRDPKEAAWPLP